MSQERFPAASKRRSAKNNLSLEQMIAASPGKTPIQMLHEYGTKIGKPPIYYMEKAEGNAHLPSFIFNVEIGAVTSTGQGLSKRAAKHKAAEAALNILKREPGMSIPFPKTELSDSPKQTQNQSNPIGTLQELAVQKGWRLPEYSVALESGPAHKRDFSVTCRIETFLVTGSGSSKKIAKRSAAEQMLAKLQNLPDSSDTPGTSGFRWESLKDSTAEKITILKRNPLSIPNTDYVQMLSDLSQEQGFEVTFLDIDELTVNGQYQCLAEIAASPVTVCHGTGISCGNAHNDAAHSALQYVKIMAISK
ncbi:interferon-inducible double-stranded RNA-dependent protein kinase activator A homolog A-like [Polyodon spathula]|uniref:interferon-inducible double-stranded RNA-dependent protein kinase activator A homolog A-like n=1 Tax=Polyodon spathula TaxID=7913 RepID=UPI001B7EDE92|nr:interferon-inducible double-stranded RNA-dependent protein kinase activator A homolog A-like [Polyodon spathula]